VTFPKGAIQPIPNAESGLRITNYGLRITDCGVREVVEYAGSRTALVAGCTHPRLAQAVVHGCTHPRSRLAEMRLLVPRQDVDLLQLLRAQGVTGEAMEITGHTMRVVNLPGLMSDLRSYVKGRLTEEQRRGLRFEQQGDRCVIVRAQERLELHTCPA